VNNTFKPVTTNPFLASFEQQEAPQSSNPPIHISSSVPSNMAQPAAIDSEAAQLFVCACPFTLLMAVG
jgi:hypothetical protein